MSKQIELAKKLKALAERGVGGEKLNAEKMLADFIAKHGINIEDIEDEKVEPRFFYLKDESDAQLAFQIVRVVDQNLSLFGPLKKTDIKKFQFKGNYFTRCTLSQFIEIESMIAIYAPLYKEELDVFYRAFLTANDLLITPKVMRDVSDFSKEEIDKYRRSQEMSNSIAVRQRLKQIESQKS